MSTNDSAQPGEFWRQTLLNNDRNAHDAETRGACLLEVEALRIHCSELAAALTQARAAIAVRHGLLSDQSVALSERDRTIEERDKVITGQDEQLTNLHRRIRELDTQLDAILSSRRWRVATAISMVRPKFVAERLRRRTMRFGRSK
ncbi:hypothetical protein [Rhodococcus opacus]|uniref:hypothetical protein n=1 Tax=Rhodococcus opacus TaxID=37919 RepID=UPI0024B8C951|nr:hypothetical protein [Rhodococcus opacus]MDJ0414393.1 hypothetical protein [Rhodococcus opacus]